MTYAVRQDYIDRFGVGELVQLVDRDQDDDEDSGVLEQAMADAGAEIDSYLASRYALPLSPVPAVLVRVCCDITRYRLFDNRATEEVRTRYSDAVKYLKDVASGLVQLGAAAPASSSANDSVPLYSSADRVFSASKLSDY